MPFFDFLDDVGGFISSAAASAGKKKKPPEVPVMSEDEYQKLLGSAGRPVTRFNARESEDLAASRIPEEKVAGLQKRNKLESDIKNLALDIVNREKQGFSDTADDTLTAPIYRQGIGGISRTTRTILQRLGLPMTPQLQARLAQLEDLESSGAQAQEAAPGAPYRAGSGKLEAASKTVGEVDQALKYAVTPEQQARLQQQRQQAMSTLDPDGKVAEAEAMAKMSPMPPSQTIEGAAKAAGVPDRDFQDAIAEAAQKLGVDMDEQVEFPLALQRLLNSPEFAEVRPDFEALGQVPGVGQAAQAGKEGEAQAQAPQDLHAEERMLLTQIAAKKDINTWYEAIAFVILSMLIKPQMAIFFFSRASERGELKAQLQENRQKQRERKEQEQLAAEAAKEKRRQAAELQKALAVEGFRQYGQEKDDRRTFRKEWLQLVFKAATTRQKAQQDPIAKAFQDDMENWLKLAGEKSRAMKYDEADLLVAKAMAMQERLREYLGLPAFEEEVAK